MEYIFKRKYARDIRSVSLDAYMILSLHLFVGQITSLNERLFENVLLQLAIRVDLFLHQLRQIDIYLLIFSILITSQSGSTES